MFTIWPRIVWLTRAASRRCRCTPDTAPARCLARRRTRRSRALDEGREPDLAGDAGDGLGQSDRQLVAQVGAGHHPLTPRGRRPG